MAAGEKRREGKKPSRVIHRMADGSVLYNDEIANYPLPFGIPTVAARLIWRIMMTEIPEDREKRLAQEAAQKTTGNA